ncbi:hypothetical protein BC941DRAFT_424492 [Chlamydoabsidia padenii]|nr:hypothetical protein BC941DRAFT_424492 [Chlamydoabsidia padenii]
MAKEKIPKKTKKASAYNLYMKEELPKLKKENPGLNHKEAFKKVAESWAASPKNPKNK